MNVYKRMATEGFCETKMNHFGTSFANYAPQLNLVPTPAVWNSRTISCGTGRRDISATQVTSNA